MPSLFSRSRTNSTPKKHSLPSDNTLDEFGRLSSTNVNTPVSKQDKKKAKQHEKRLRTFSHSKENREQPFPTTEAQQTLPDGSFLPTNLERPRDELGGILPPSELDYGYLSYERHVVLGIEDVARLVEVVVDELVTRGGITTPFIFSSLAIDVSSSAVKRLIRAFLEACQERMLTGRSPQDKGGKAERRWREEARFAGPHELGMCLRWGLARVIRIFGGQEVKGIIPWDLYSDFRTSEAALSYPPSHFATILPNVQLPVRSILLTTLSLLTRLTANSTSSGHTPPTLSPLFGPLFFGLGEPNLPFHITYTRYLEAVHATEHLILAFIRWQDAPSARPGTASSRTTTIPEQSIGIISALGVPTRLKEWIKGYPATLPAFQQNSRDRRPQARRGARTIRVLSVRRNARTYSKDLVRSGATWGWAYRRAGSEGSNISAVPINALATCKEWERITPHKVNFPPRYTDAYKKRMDMGRGVEPEYAPGSGASSLSSSISSAPSTSSYTSTISSTTTASPSLLDDKDLLSLGIGAESETRFRSLTDLRWGEFETMGFGGLGVDSEAGKKLQFDLTESARTARLAKRTTLTWKDFSAAGFSRTDEPLAATLSFSVPLTSSVTSWPEHSSEINKKLRKAQKQLPAFGWDTEPVLGGEDVIEEAFVDVFCDLVYGSGWMDHERGDDIDRECNWALVEFKSLPQSRPNTSSSTSSSSDPRTSTTMILFEEFVPLEYRQKLAMGSSGRRRLPSLFSPSKSKQWKPAATLNGRPYVVGSVPHSPSVREMEFEGLLRGGGATKVISLGGTQSTAIATDLRLSKDMNSGEGRATPRPPELPSKSEDSHTAPISSPSATRKPRFKLPTVPSPHAAHHRKAHIPPAEYSSVDFETRLASYSDDEVSNGRADEPEDVKQKRRESSSDAWVDILVATHNRRMGEQDAELKPSGERRRQKHNGGQDPELASLEVAQVLASVQQDLSPSPHSDEERFQQQQARYDERLHGQLHQQHDVDVDEIETVPRTRGGHYDSGIDDDTLESASGAEPEMEPVLDEEELEIPLSMRRPKGLGYFDLHPDRRRMVADTGEGAEEDDPRLILADEDSDDEKDEDVYGPPEPASHVRPLPRPPVSPMSIGTESNPAYSPGVDVSGFDQAEEDRRAERERTQARVESLVMPTTPMKHASEQGNGHGNGNGASMIPKPIVTSRTATLIEMYRERERGASPKPVPPAVPTPSSVPAQSSRLPIRATSLPATKENSPAPTPLVPQAKQVPFPHDHTLVEPPLVAHEETGRSSPARYVHGAPLHNVLEEEEEE